MSKPSSFTIFCHDLESQTMIPQSEDIKIVTQADLSLVNEINLFIFTSITQLSEITEIISLANQKHHLKALLIRENINAKWLISILDIINLRVLHHTHVYQDLNLIKRVMNAWEWGAEDHLIAEATVINDTLLMVSCGMEKIEVSFEKMSALRSIKKEERANFILSEEGSYLYWESADIHLDLDAIRSVIDLKWQEKYQAQTLIHHQLFGKAIATLRKQSKLKQSDIIGLSSKQVSRIENGENTKVETLNLFAQAHGMTLKDYLNAVASLIDPIPSEMCYPVDQQSSEYDSLDELRKLIGTEETVSIKKINANTNH